MGDIGVGQQMLYTVIYQVILQEWSGTWWKTSGNATRSKICMVRKTNMDMLLKGKPSVLCILYPNQAKNEVCTPANHAHGKTCRDFCENEKGTCDALVNDLEKCVTSKCCKLAEELHVNQTWYDIRRSSWGCAEGGTCVPDQAHNGTTFEQCRSSCTAALVV